MTTKVTFFSFFIAIIVVPAISTGPIQFTIHNQRLHSIDTRIFGHFLERASFGEPGFDALDLDSTGFPSSHIVKILKDMHIPVIRFPAGSDMPHIDWRDMIDHVPGRKGPRPLFQPNQSRKALSNALGIDEFLRLCDTINSEPILVVNFYDALSGKRTLAEATMLAAGLVAYCNAPVGANLPDNMPDWPSIRAKMGKPVLDSRHPVAGCHPSPALITLPPTGSESLLTDRSG